MNEVRDPPAGLGSSLGPLLPSHLSMGRKWEEGKEKEDFLEVSHTLLLHFMWSEPTCLGRPGHVGFIPETVCRNQSQDSVSKEERGMDTGSPLAGSAVELIKAHS